MTRFLVAALVLLGLLSRADAAVSVVQEKSAGGGAVATLAVTLTSPTSAGSVVVCGANGNTATAITFTDDKSDTPADSGKGTISGDVAASAIGAFPTTTAGAQVFTAHFSPSTGGFSEIACWEVAGLTGTVTFDQVAQHSATTGTTMTSQATGTLASATEIGIGYLISQNGATGAGQGASWVKDEGGTGLTANGNFAIHIITTSTAAITATGGQGNGRYDAWAATLKGSAAAVCKDTRAAMGVGC